MDASNNMPEPDRPTPVWTLSAGGRVTWCEMVAVDAGTEVRVVGDGALCILRLFRSVWEALTWAEEERVDLVAHGWRPPERNPPAPSAPTA